MKVISSHQNDALGRQCGEAIWIKEIDPSKRINNKEEYHQPGDVEIKYSKNDHETKEKRKDKLIPVQNCENQKEVIENGKDKENEQRRITEFFVKSVRKECEKSENEDTILNTQEFIEDARARRNLRLRNESENDIACDQCDYKTTSKTLLNRHIENIHAEVKKQETLEIRQRFNCDKCDFKTTSKTALTNHMSTKHENKEKKISKRKVCVICLKRFNKISTYNEHMNKQHKEGHSVQNKKVQIESLK